jgi:Right handed beta helix region
MRQSGIIAATVLAGAVSAALAGPLPRTNTFTVDCNRHQTIADAIARGDERKPLVITVRGTCHESVSIARDDVTLQGDPTAAGAVSGPDPNVNTLQILASRVTVDDLTIAGGRVGVQVQDAYGALIQNTVIEHTALDGIRIFVGDADVTGCTVRQTGGAGIAVNRGGVLRLLNSQVRDNPAVGIGVAGNSTLNATGNTIVHNGGNGIDLGSGSQGSFADNTISDNGANPDLQGNGLSAWGASRAQVGGNNVITGNRETGILVAGGSTAYVTSDTITGNGGNGVFGYLAATLVIDGDTISNNGANGVDCTANCTAQIMGSTIQGNVYSGINLALDSTLLLQPPTTDATGNGGMGLYCNDGESSAADVSNLTGGTNCTGF